MKSRRKFLDEGGKVAVVFNSETMPREYKGYYVVDANEYDMRYLDLDDTYITKAVMIDPTDPEKYCLSAVSNYNSRTRLIYLDDINNNIVIEQEIIELAFDVFSKFNKN